MAQVTIPIDNWGTIDSGPKSTFTDAQGATSGTVLSNSSTPNVRVSAVEGRGGEEFTIRRTFAKWDTSTYAGSITGMQFVFVSDAFNGTSTYIIQESTSFKGEGGTLAPTDYNNIEEIDYAEGSWASSGTTISFTASPAAIMAANAGEVIAVLRNYENDYLNSAPMFLPYNDSIGISGNNISLSLTYTSGYSNSVNGVGDGIIGSINGVSTSQVVSVSGV